MEYSLSREYQLREIDVTMQLILPLDVLYAVISSIYYILVALLRTQISMGTLSMGKYMALSDWTYCVMFTLIIFFYFIFYFIVISIKNYKKSSNYNK